MKVLIRADANSQIGAGHLMRCLALAQGLKCAGHEAIFLTRTESIKLQERLESEGFEIHLLDKEFGLQDDARQTKKLAEYLGCHWVVADGYNFTEEFQQIIIDFSTSTLEPRQGRTKLLCIDDTAKTHFVADAVLNQNISASGEHYSGEHYTHLLLGTEYALIRKEFLQAKDTFVRQFPEKAKNILISFGGADSGNITLKVLQAIDILNDPEIVIRVVAGELNPNIEALRNFITKSSSNFEILTHVGNEMPELMKWADLAIGTGGSTCWELCLLKVPTIAGIVTDNQENIACALSDIGAVRNVGWLIERSVQELADDIDNCIQDSALRKSMSDSMAQVVDGRGVQRVVLELENAIQPRVWEIQEGDFAIRNALRGDCELLWWWVNDISTRINAFQSNKIGWEEHLRWFLNKLKGPGSMIYLGFFQGEPVGQVRFDRSDDGAEVDISISPEFRNKGMGSILLQHGSRLIFNSWQTSKLVGWIKASNLASIKTFKKVGFQSELQTEHKGFACVKMVLYRTSAE